jgi:hypothetical protein
MRAITFSFMAVLAGFVMGAQEATGQTPGAVSENPPLNTEVTCKPAYYRRSNDGCLVPAEAARETADFEASGIIFMIVKPSALEGQVVALHFDWPKKWDRLYKADVLYTGFAHTQDIGRIAFLCDTGSWRPASTNRPSLQGGANGKQPSGPETNQTPAAPASHRSP